VRYKQFSRFILLTLLSALLLPPASSAQIDIRISGAGPIRYLAQNVAWSGSGAGTLANAYIFTPQFTNEGVCLYVADLGNTGGGNLTLNTFIVGDQKVINYYTANNQSAWVPTGPQNATVRAVSQGATAAFYVSLQGASRAAVVITSTSGGSGGAGVTVSMVEAANQTGCGNIPVSQVACTSLFTVSSLASSTSVQVWSGVSGEAPYVCNLTISFAAAPATGSVNLIIGTGSTCASQTVNVFTIATGPNTPLVNTFHGQPLTTRLTVSGHGDLQGFGLCIQNSQTTPVTVSLTTSQF
jgi:hypothetical protein